MSVEAAVGTNGKRPRLGWPMLKRLVMLLLFVVLWGGALFMAAGRLDWPRGWMCMGLYLLSIAMNVILVVWKNPGLIEERWKRHKGTKSFDKVFAVVYTPLAFGLPVVAGLDAARFGWSSMAFETLYVGAVLHVLGAVPIAWAMATNPYLEKTVRIQTERGHKVVTTGPYRMVRHPMYVGAILQYVAVPLVLGSQWAYVPAGAAIIMFMVRTALEDRTLRKELTGYEEYTRQTRYRVIPGVW